MILDKVMNKETVSEIGIITKVKFNRHIGLAPIFRE